MSSFFFYFAFSFSPSVPGMCVKTLSEPGKQKVFVNICQSNSVPQPPELSREELVQLLQSEDPSGYRVPMSLGEPHTEVDNSTWLNPHGCFFLDRHLYYLNIHHFWQVNLWFDCPSYPVYKIVKLTLILLHFIVIQCNLQWGSQQTLNCCLHNFRTGFFSNMSNLNGMLVSGKASRGEGKDLLFIRRLCLCSSVDHVQQNWQKHMSNKIHSASREQVQPNRSLWTSCKLKFSLRFTWGSSNHQSKRSVFEFTQLNCFLYLYLD